MDDASSVAPQGDMMPPTDGQNLGSGDGFEPQGDDMNMGGETPDMGGNEPTGKVKEIMDTANAISEKDQDTLLKYARSLKDASEENGDEEGGDMPDMGGEPQMPMESFIFTKGQLNKLNEEFGIENLSGEKEDNKPNEKKLHKTSKKSPFDSPSFN